MSFRLKQYDRLQTQLDLPHSRLFERHEIDINEFQSHLDSSLTIVNLDGCIELSIIRHLHPEQQAQNYDVCLDRS